MDPNFDSLDWTESASSVGFDDDLEMESAESDLSKLICPLNSFITYTVII